MNIFYLLLIHTSSLRIVERLLNETDMEMFVFTGQFELQAPTLGNINKLFLDFTKLFCLFFITDKSAFSLQNVFVNDVNLNIVQSSRDILLE